MVELKEKRILITGGTSGLGNSLVRLFLNNGWKVATLGRRRILLDELKAGYPEHQLFAESCDIRVESQVRNFLSRVKEKFGGIDVCLLNAGTLGPTELPSIRKLSLLDLRMTFETNLFANFNFLKGAFDLNDDKLVLVHITSDAVNGIYPGWGAYGASKSAMDFIINTLQNEADSKDTVAFSFDPGDMDTEMHRLALPGDKDLKSPDQSAKELYEKILERVGDN